MTSKIYKITNLINNKVYIGYTSKDIQLRFKQHCMYRRAGKISLIHKAILKYGKENFTIECIEESDNDKYIHEEREEYWIVKYNARNPKFGYNIAKGGTGGDTFTTNPNKDEIRIGNGNGSRGKIIYHDPITLKSRRIPLTENPPEGWIKGRPEIWNKKLGMKHVGVIPANKGKKLTEEEKLHTSKVTQEAMNKMERKTCPYCNKTVVWFNYNLYHGEKCKYKNKN